MTIELRCQAKLHGLVIGPLGQDTIIEVACTSRFCGAEKGVVVRHRLRLNPDQTLACETRRYKSPERRATNGKPSGAHASVRTA